MNKIITAVLVSALFMSCKRELPFEEFAQKKASNGTANSFTATITIGGRTVTISDYSVYNARTKEYDYFNPDQIGEAAVSFRYQRYYNPGSLLQTPYNHIVLQRHTGGRIVFHIPIDSTGNYEDYALIDDPADSIGVIAWNGYGPYPNKAIISYTVTKTKQGDALNANFIISGNDNYTQEHFSIVGSFKNMVKLEPYPSPYTNNDFQTIKPFQWKKLD